MNIPQILLFLYLFGFITSNQVQVSCIQDTTCQSGYSYLYKSQESNISRCSPVQCQRTFSSTFKYQRCTVDFNGQRCQSQICLNSDSIETCFDEDDQCPTQLDYSISCGNCEDNSCSTGKCLNTQGFEICYQQNQCIFDRLTGRIQNCRNNVDSFGKRCGCCLAIKTTDSKIGICSNDNFLDQNFRQPSFEWNASLTIILVLIIQLLVA